MNVLAWPLIFLVRAYQWLISPILPGACRFEPSCSAYTVTALRRFGPLVGSLLAVHRIVRCHPWGDCGEDPVPERLDGSSPWQILKKSPPPERRGALR